MGINIPRVGNALRLASLLFVFFVVARWLLTTSFDDSLSSWAALLIMLASCFIVWLPGFALAAVLPQGSSLTSLLAAVVIGVGVSGALMFGMWFAGGGLGRWWAVITVLSSVITISYRPDNLRTIAWPVMTALIVSMLYFAVVSDHYGLQNANTMVAHRYWVSVDNKIPQIFADGVISGRDSLKPYLVGDWLSSDRPPLMTGIMLSSYPFAVAETKNLLALTLGIAANAMWIFGLWAFLLATGVSRRVTGYVIIVVALTGAVFVNTIYVWPKFIAAAFALSAGALFLGSQNTITPFRACAIGLCFSLGMLSHGGVIFGLIGLLPLVFVNRVSWSTKSFAALLASAIFVYAPWVAYQKFFDPPGDRLIKWHLAGITQPSLDPPASAIYHAYASPSVGDILAFKATNLSILIGLSNANHEGHHPLEGWESDLEGQLRKNQLYFLGLAPGVALLGLLAFAVGSRRKWVKPVIIAALSSAIAYCLIEYGGNYSSAAWLHTAPYSLLLLWIALGPLAVAERPIGSKILLLAVAGTFIWLWVIGPSHSAALKGHVLGSASPLMIMVQLVMIFALLLMVWTKPSKADY